MAGSMRGVGNIQDVPGASCNGRKSKKAQRKPATTTLMGVCQRDTGGN